MRPGRKQPPHQHPQRAERSYVKPTELRKQKRAEYQAEIAELVRRIRAETPKRGVNPLLGESVVNADNTVSYPNARRFADFPISKQTVDLLAKSNFTQLTPIQRAAIPHALAGRDVIGAAKTGSGKTLAFLIPLVETLFRLQWGPMDGLAAIVLTPTRELAQQIFNVYRLIDGYRSYAALITGGKDEKSEAQVIGKMNVLICTPGRLLYHLDSTPTFDPTPLRMLVIDEADRILDMGFRDALTAILEHLPTQRQTLLFSATQTKSVKDLIRLSLRHPEFISVDEHAEHATPATLTQHYMLLADAEKLDVLFSFLKTHPAAKVIVFFATSKQVRFVYETFRKLRIGLPSFLLYGNQSHNSRTTTYEEFARTRRAVLFCTDIASRGLDIKGVDWIVQYDCPEDTDQYIHRVGRTARMNSDGHALLLLTWNEEAFLGLLEKARVPLDRVAPNTGRLRRVAADIDELFPRFPELKRYAEKAVRAYLYSVQTMKNKDVFQHDRIDEAALRASYGLVARTIEEPADAEGGETATDGAGSDDDLFSVAETQIVDAMKPAVVVAKPKQKKRPMKPQGRCVVLDGEGDDGQDKVAEMREQLVEAAEEDKKTFRQRMREKRAKERSKRKGVAAIRVEERKREVSAEEDGPARKQSVEEMAAARLRGSSLF